MATDAAPISSGSFSLKLIIDTKKNKVLCAEAGKDFVDFLFNFLTMPIGSIARLLKDHRPAAAALAGCVGELSTGIENMDQSCFQSAESKDFLLTKLRGETHVTTVPLLPVDPNRSMKRTIFKCSRHTTGSAQSLRCTTDSRSGCPFSTGMEFTDASGWCREADFVKGALRYLVEDDLTVSPLEYSMISGASLLMTKFKVKDFGDIQERVVQVGMNEGLELLWAVMHTKSALTTVFLGKAEKPRRMPN